MCIGGDDFLDAIFVIPASSPVYTELSRVLAR
jgi:hypothetical protein